MYATVVGSVAQASMTPESAWVLPWPQVPIPFLRLQVHPRNQLDTFSEEPYQSVPSSDHWIQNIRWTERFCTRVHQEDSFWSMHLMLPVVQYTLPPHGRSPGHAPHACVWYAQHTQGPTNQGRGLGNRVSKSSK
jgi:hypothetical protein